MKVLTNTAKGMIENAVWDTYGVEWPEDGVTDSSFASKAYLEVKVKVSRRDLRKDTNA